MADTPKAAFVEPLKLTDLDHARLVASSTRPDHRRHHVRFSAPPGFKVLVRFDTGSAATIAVRVAVSDLSVGGIGLFHSAFIPVGARCIVSMLNIGREAVAVRGVVAHCEFVAGRAHVVGIRFDMAVEPADFIATSAKAPAVRDGVAGGSTSIDSVIDLDTDDEHPVASAAGMGPVAALSA